MLDPDYQVILTGQKNPITHLYHANCRVVPANSPSRSLLVLNSQELMHEHLSRGHPSFNKIRNQFGMSALTVAELPKCDSCLTWNMKSKPSKKSNSTQAKTKRAMERFQIDKGQMSVSTWTYEFYFQVVIDIHTREFWAQFLRLKNEDLSVFKWLLTQLKTTKPHLRLGVLEADGEYNGQVWHNFARDEGFVIKITSPYTQKAWYAERVIGLLRRIVMP